MHPNKKRWDPQKTKSEKRELLTPQKYKGCKKILHTAVCQQIAQSGTNG